MNSVKDPTQEKQLDNPVRSPFQLNKTKGPVKLIPLHAAIRESSGHGTPLSHSTPATSSTSPFGTVGSTDHEIMSPKSSLGESPFSFSVQKVESVNLSPRSSHHGGSFTSDSQKLIEHQKEIAKLKRDIETKNKDIESKEAKLSSSVKSIKQFWSPELKKERALRKEEEERTKLVEEKLQIGNKELEACRATVQQLETELCSNKEEVISLTTQSKNQNLEINNLQNEIEKLREECEGIVTLHEKIIRLEDTNKKLIDESHNKSGTISELEKKLSINDRLEEDFITTEKKLQAEYGAHKETRKVLEKYKEEARKLKQDRSVNEYKKDVAHLQEELFTIKDDLSQKEKLYEKAKHDVAMLRKRENYYSEKVDELEHIFTVKNEECEGLNEEVAILNEAKKKVEEDLNTSSHARQLSEDKYNDLRNSQQTLLKQFDELKNIYDSTESQKCDLETDIERLLEKIKEFTDGEEKLVGENRRLEGELSSILASQEEGKTTLKALQNADKRLCGQLEEQQERLDDIWEQNKKYEKENEILMKQNNHIEKEKKELKEKLETQVNENVKLKKVEEELQKEHLIAQESIKLLEEKYRSSHSKSVQMGEKITDLENQLQKAKSAGMSSSRLNEDLRLKTKEVQELSLKYNNLNQYLSDRELALDNCREEVAELKEKTDGYASSNIQFRKQVDEQKMLLDTLEKEKIQLEKSKEECVPVLTYEKLKTVFESMKGKHENQRKLLEEKDEKLKRLENNLKEKEKTNKDLAEKLKVSDCSNMVDTSQLEKIQNEKDELTKEITFLKIKVGTLEKQRIGAVVEDKPLVAKKNLWDELSRKDSRIDELEKLLKEKARQLTAFKKSKSIEWEKQQIQITETKKVEEDTDLQLKKLKTDNEQKANRISLLEEALREMVAVAKERENIMARYAEVYEEVEKKYEEADCEYSRICFERSITNIKNALLILILCEREALISSMKVSRKGYLDALFGLRQERLIASISEMDTQIAHMESQSPKGRRDEIKQMRQEKEKYVSQLKELNNQCIILITNEDRMHCITNELKEAPPEQIYEAMRHLSHTNTLLESKVEEFLTFLREKNAELLKDISDVPVKNFRPIEQLMTLPKDELLKELMVIEEHSANLQKFVEELLTLLEGDQ